VCRNSVIINLDTIQPKNTLPGHERLKSRKIIQQLFKEGKAFSVFPLRVVYLEVSNIEPLLQAGFTVGTKHFKRAVKRNRIKRLLRETYRLNKHSLKSSLEEKNIHLAVFFMFTGKELPEYPLVLEKMNVVLEKLKRLVSEDV
jgi:ribonuclease P protein component